MKTDSIPLDEVEGVSAAPSAVDSPSAADEAMRPIEKPRARRIVVAAAFAVVCAGIVLNLGTGTFSSFGWESIASICPLGAVETMVAGKLLVPRALVFLAVAAVVAIALGKVFCSWACPVPGVKSVVDSVRGKTARIATRKGVSDGEPTSIHVESGASCSSCSSCVSRARFDSRHLVLGGTLLSAAVFGFPVFCLVCPIGLTFATVVAFVQLFGMQTLSWGLLLFPLILVLELTVLRKWCSRFCPLGALMSLLSLPNRWLRPKVDESRCLRGKGVDCQVCTGVCPEELDPHVAEGMHDCSKCGDCAANCPAKAISFPARRA